MISVFADENVEIVIAPCEIHADERVCRAEFKIVLNTSSAWRSQCYDLCLETRGMDHQNIPRPFPVRALTRRVYRRPRLEENTKIVLIIKRQVSPFSRWYTACGRSTFTLLLNRYGCDYYATKAIKRAYAY